MTDIVDVAAAEIGTVEGSTRHVAYLRWFYGSRYDSSPAYYKSLAWCAIFVSWCGGQVGGAFPKEAAVSSVKSWFEKQKQYQNKSNYSPKRGDIIIFKNNRSHVGIVEKLQGNTVYTIEGNTSNKVLRRQYSITNPTITGYGIPNYTGGVNNVNQTPEDKKQGADTELKYLKKITERKPSPLPQQTMEVKMKKAHAQVATEIYINNGKKTFNIPVLEDIQWSLERSGTPGKLTFKVIPLKDYALSEGNSVLLTVDGKKIFYGFIFSLQNGRDKTVSVTAYDQLRYLKNKYTYIYENQTASQLIKKIAKDFRLQCGTIADTKYKMTKVEDNTALYDVILNALDETLMVKGQLYILYDKVGKITLRNISTLKVNYVLDQDTAENFDYKTSIDSNTYNKVVLGYENKESGELETYVSQHSKNINKWGVLQYFEKIDDPSLGELKSEALLSMYNKPTKTLSISGAIGHVNVIAGCMILVILNVGTIKVRNYMLVEKVTHKFEQGAHSMDLTLSGGVFDAAK